MCAAGAVVAALAGCVTTPPPPAAGAPVVEAPISHLEVERAIERRRAMALKAEQDGDLVGAATQWRLVLLLAANDGQAAERLAALRASAAEVVKTELAAGRDALRRGDNERASQSLLRVLVFDADNRQAIDALRELDRQRAMRRAADRAVRAQMETSTVAAKSSGARRPSTEAGDYEVEQSLELLRAGDSAVALAELRRYVSANPGDRVLRERIAGTLYSRAQELERQEGGGAAVAMYGEAVRIHSSPPQAWTVHLSQLKMRLAGQEYEKGVRLMTTNVAAAITHFEAALRLSPNHAQAQLQLQRARKMQQKLQSISPTRSAN